MNTKLLFGMLVLLAIASYTSCKHEPNVKITTTTNDTTDTTITPKDTIKNGNPCSPDTVYFERDILPLIGSNCAKSGCHDAITSADGVNYSTYNSTINTGKVDPGRPANSKMYTMLSKTGEIMPPPPNTN